MALTKTPIELSSTPSIVDGGNATAITIDSSENVGIGTSSPDTRLQIKGSVNSSQLILGGTDNRGLKISTTAVGGQNDSGVIFDAQDTEASGANSTLIFSTGGSERMRIDGSGNLLVGRTSVGTSGAGHSIRGDSSAIFSRTSGEAISANSDADGAVIKIRKSGTTVGSIGVGSGSLFIAGNSTENTGIRCYNVGIAPCTNTGAYIDNARDLGSSSVRWDDIYASNGTIQTSDRNEKQDIEALSDAEQRVAVAAKGLMRKFRWIDAVEAKGDDARIHFGIIAQDLQAAFEAEGLDAGRYAMFMSNTWWETQTEVAAVEATEDAEAVNAYTRTDTYDTAEEAPEGATERTRLGVRYSELLAFIIAAI